MVSFQVQHGLGHGHGPQQSSGQSRPLASTGGDSQPAERHAQRGRRSTRRGREPAGHRRPQPRYQPVHRRSAGGHQAGVRPPVYSHSWSIVVMITAADTKSVGCGSFLILHSAANSWQHQSSFLFMFILLILPFLFSGDLTTVNPTSVACNLVWVLWGKISHVQLFDKSTIFVFISYLPLSHMRIVAYSGFIQHSAIFSFFHGLTRTVLQSRRGTIWEYIYIFNKSCDILRKINYCIISTVHTL